MKATHHEAKTFVEHLKKMHEEGNRGFEKEFKVNELKHDYNKFLSYEPVHLFLSYMNLQM